MPLKNVSNQCTATSKRTGKRCPNPSVTGYNVCYHHGANPTNHGGRKKGCKKPAGAGGPAWGNTNALKHGAYSARMAPDEQPYFEAIKAEFEQELGGSEKLSASDRLLVFRLAFNAAKMTGAFQKGADAAAVLAHHRMEMDLLRELKATRATQNDPSAGGTSAAEVMAELLTRVRARAISLQQPTVHPEGDDVIECEVADEGATTDA